MHFIVLVMCFVIYNLFGAKAAPFIDNKISSSSKDDADNLDRKVFHLPSRLKKFEEIHIEGLFFNSTERLTVNLVTAKMDNSGPNFENIACQLKLDFVSKSVTINKIVGGVHGPPKDEGLEPDDWFSDLDFSIAFKIVSEATIALELQTSNTEHSCELEHHLDDITYLTVGGDYDQVKSLRFILAS